MGRTATPLKALNIRRFQARQLLQDAVLGDLLEADFCLVEEDARQGGRAVADVDGVVAFGEGGVEDAQRASSEGGTLGGDFLAASVWGTGRPPTFRRP